MDQWFTGKPQRTYFETKSEPRVNRSRESFELPFDNQPTYGQTGRCTVPPKGDFLTGLTLRTVLSPIYPTVPGQYVYPKASSEVGANVYVNLGLTFAIADGVTLTANTNGNHYFSVGAQVTLTGAKTYTGSGFLIYDLDGTYTIATIPTANSFTCSSTVAGTATTGTVSSLGIACADIVSYFSTQNSNLWVNNLTNKTWQIVAGSNIGANWTFTTSTPSNFPVGSQVVLNLPGASIINKTSTVISSTDTTFTIDNYPYFFISVSSTVYYTSIPEAISIDNGKTWTSNYPTSGTTISALAFGNGTFVAGAYDYLGSENLQLYSIDNGKTWTHVHSSISVGYPGWASAAYGNGTFVMVGRDSQAYSTDDGRTWTQVSSPLSGYFISVAFGNGTFVMAGYGPSAYSTDNGQTWTQVSPGYGNSVAYGNGVFVAVGENSQAYSTDNGQTWIPVSNMLPGAWLGAAYGNGTFVMVGWDNSYYYYPPGLQAYSTDNGQTWTLVDNPLQGIWRSVTFGNGKFVMSGGEYNQGSTYVHGYSDDNGLTWNHADNYIIGTWTVTSGTSYNNSPSDSVSLVNPPLQLSGRNFISDTYPSIRFANADDAAFWGFDARQGLTYELPAIPPWTLTQSGWITGFLPPSLSTYADSAAHKLVKSARILIGKQTIKEFTGEYIELQNDLWVPYENKAILKLLNGTLDQTQSVTAREYYVRIPLGTHEYPLCALTQQHLSVQFDFDQYSALSDNLNQGTGQFTDLKSFTEYDGLSLNVQTTFSYQQYIFVVATDGRLIVYDTSKSFTDPTSYQIITALAGSTSLFSQFCVLSGVLYIGLTNGQLIRGNLSELIQGNTRSFVLNNYTPTNGSLTGTLVADFRYIYYSVSNTVNSNVFVSKYDTTSGFQNPASYTLVDFTKTFNSNVTGVYQTLSDGKQLVLLPNGSPGKLYTFQLNANVQSQWYILDYSAYGHQITEGVLVNNDFYFVSDSKQIITYKNSQLYRYFFEDLFVMVGYGVQAYYLQNSNAWTSSSVQLTDFWKSVAYGNETFVMGSNYSQAYSTDNAQTWTRIESPISANWLSIAFGNGVFVSTDQVYSLDNGRTWVFADNHLSGYFKSVAYGNGVFVMVGENVQAYSVDGKSWTYADNIINQNMNSVAYGNGTFVMVCFENDNVAYSNDGKTWTSVDSMTDVRYFSVAFGNGIFVATGLDVNTSAGMQVYSIDNGQTWNRASSPFDAMNSVVTFSMGMFIGIVTNYYQFYSLDGNTWALLPNQIIGGWFYGTTKPAAFSIAGDQFRNLHAVGNYIYVSTNQVAIQIDTTKDLSSQTAYQIAPLTSGQYIFANGPRYVYLFNQGSSGPIQRFDPYTPDTTFKASIIADYESLPSGVPKPDKAILSIIQSQNVANMSDLKLQGPIREIWFTGEPGSNVYEYSNLAAQSSLSFNGEDIVTPDVGTQKFLSVIEPFETHTTMPVRNISVVAFEQDPESDIPNGTVNFSRIREQVFDGGATSAWARSINVLKIQGGLGGLMFN